MIKLPTDILRYITNSCPEALQVLKETCKDLYISLSEIEKPELSSLSNYIIGSGSYSLYKWFEDKILYGNNFFNKQHYLDIIPIITRELTSSPHEDLEYNNYKYIYYNEYYEGLLNGTLTTQEIESLTDELIDNLKDYGIYRFLFSKEPLVYSNKTETINLVPNWDTIVDKSELSDYYGMIIQDIDEIYDDIKITEYKWGVYNVLQIVLFH